MIDTKLIIIDGIWGSGKTATLIVLSRHLNQCGIQSRTYKDDDPHNSALREYFDAAPSEVDPNVDGWERFSEELRRSNEVAVMESGLFNCPMMSLLINGYNTNQIIDYCLRVFETVKESNPVILHLQHEDVSSSWSSVCEQRGSEWRQFMERQLHSWFPSQPPQYSVMDDFLYDLTSLSDRAFGEWPGGKLALATPPDNWRDQYRKITDFLSLPPIEPPGPSFDDHIGRYRETQSGRECVISVLGNILILRGYFGPKRPLLFDMYAMDDPLIDNDRGRFSRQGHMYADVVFERNRQGSVASMRVVDEQVIQPIGTSGDCCKDTVWLKVGD